MKINETSKSLVERLSDFRCLLLSVFGCIGTISAPDVRTLKEESHALQCTIAVLQCHTQFFSVSGSSMALPKAEQFVNTTVLLFKLSLPHAREDSSQREWRLAPSRLMSMCARWIVLAKLPIHTGGKIKKAATTLLCDTIQKRDFADKLPHGRPRFWDRSVDIVAQIWTMIRNAARVARPGLLVGILRVLCNGMCTAKRFHVDNEEQTCRVGCSDESDCL